MSRKIRLLIADDQREDFKEGLFNLLSSQDDMEVVGTVDDGAMVAPRAAELDPDVVLLDLGMPGGGLRALEELGTLSPPVRVLVLAMHEDISLLRSVLAVGALGYVVHRSSQAEILSVIRKIHRGRGYIEVPTGGLAMDPGLNPRSEARRQMDEKLAVLSKREREVLKAVAYGYTNREIAERLGISVKSIETYRYRVAEKLAFNSRADLVRFALEAGLLRTGKDGLPA